MGQRNMIYTGPMLETQHGHLQPDSCIIPYGGIPAFPQPVTRPALNPHNLPENHGPLPPRITQFNANNVFMTPFPIAINHGMQEQLPFNSNILGAFENGQFFDGFKRKNANIQYFYPVPGSSSSAGVFMNNEGTMMDGQPLVNARNRVSGSGGIGVDPVLMAGNYGGQPIQAVPNPWLDQQFCGIPYIQGPINNGGMDTITVGLHGYQITTTNRNPAPFVHPPPHQGGPHSLHHPTPPPMPPMQPHNMDPFHPQLSSTSRRLPTNNTINPFQNNTEPGPRFVGPTLPTGLRVFRPHPRDLMDDANTRYRGLPHLRLLPEDGVAILDISGYHEVGHSVDHHRDMRLDIDHMSYEELLALGEQIGSVGSGLSDDFILKHLKTRVFASSKSNEAENSIDQQLNSCVICQTIYDDQEQIGTLDCGHEYHLECVKKWLIVKNTCPVCKSTALSATTQAKES